jgi:hypothetical protein
LVENKIKIIVFIRTSTMKMLVQMVVFMAIAGVMVSSAGCQQDTSKIQAETKIAVSTPPAQIAPAAKATVEQPKTETPSQPAKIDEVPGIIKIENPVHDFGNLAPDSVNKCQYKFTNVGKGVLKISHIQSTCGCSVPDKLEKMDYNPGESGTVDVTFHAPAYPGLVTKHLYIVSNDADNSRAEITIKAVVVVKVTVDPNKIELSVNKENGGMPTLKVKSVDNVPFAITGFSITGQIATLEFDSKDKKAEHILNPKVDINKIQEISSGVIQLKIDHPDTKEVNVVFSILPMYELRPPRIILQNTEPGIVTKREVWIVNNFGKEFEIESTSSRNGYMKVVNQKKDGLNIGLDVEITPPAQEGSKRRYITDELNIKIKNGPTLTVRCSGWFKIG